LSLSASGHIRFQPSHTDSGYGTQSENDTTFEAGNDEWGSDLIYLPVRYNFISPDVIEVR